MVETQRGANGKFISNPGGTPAANGIELAETVRADTSLDSGGSEIPVIDPATITSAAGQPGDGKRKGGWPKGKKRGGGSQAQTQARPEIQSQLDVNGFKASLFYIHQGLAKITKTPELELDEQDANVLGESVGKVARHYNIRVMEKTQDWMNLFTVLTMIYGGKMFAVDQRKKAEAARKKQMMEEAQPLHGTPMYGM